MLAGVCCASSGCREPRHARHCLQWARFEGFGSTTFPETPESPSHLLAGAKFPRCAAGGGRRGASCPEKYPGCCQPLHQVSHSSTDRSVCKHQPGTTRACPILFSGSAIAQMILALLPVRTKLNYNPPKEDGSTYRIELQGVSMAIMKQILDYIFSGEVSGDALKSRVTCWYPNSVWLSLTVHMYLTHRSPWEKRPSRTWCRHPTFSSWPT